MGFFKDFKDDLSQAVNELLPDEILDDEEVVNTLVEASSDADSDIAITEEMIDNLEDNLDLDILDAILNQEEQDSNTMDDSIVVVDNFAIKESNDEILEAKEEKSMDQNVVEARNEEDKEQVTIITKGTVINGSINSDCSLYVYGTIKGDVECLGKLDIVGTVTGNCMASEVTVNSKRLVGSINSEGAVTIGHGTVVIGDVAASSGMIAGAVKGDIDVSGPVILDSSAVVKGNIKAQSIQINNGAVIEGFCSLSYASVNIDNIFE